MQILHRGAKVQIAVPAPFHHVSELTRPLGFDFGAFVSVYNRFHMRLLCHATVGLFYGAHLPHKDTKTVYVCTEMVRFAESHLGRHVPAGTSFARHFVGFFGVLFIGVQFLGKTKVEQLENPVSIESYIVWLEIPKDNIASVNVFQKLVFAHSIQL